MRAMSTLVGTVCMNTKQSHSQQLLRHSTTYVNTTINQNILRFSHISLLSHVTDHKSNDNILIHSLENLQFSKVILKLIVSI